MIKSKRTYTPQSFVDALTDRCYIFRQENTVSEIHHLLRLNGIETEENPLWDYPMDEIDHIVANGIPVVLVDVSGFNENDKWVEEYRWFEVPEDFVDPYEEREV